MLQGHLSPIYMLQQKCKSTFTLNWHLSKSCKYTYKRSNYSLYPKLIEYEHLFVKINHYAKDIVINGYSYIENSLFK